VRSEQAARRVRSASPARSALAVRAGAHRRLDGDVDAAERHPARRIYAELSLAKVDGFGSATKLSVGDRTWFAGVDFEF